MYKGEYSITESYLLQENPFRTNIEASKEKVCGRIWKLLEKWKDYDQNILHEKLKL